MKRHSTDLTSLIFGLLFVLAAGWWYAVSYLDLTLRVDLPIGWILAGGLILLGFLGVAGSLRRDRNEHPADDAAIPTAVPAAVPVATAGSERLTEPDVAGEPDVIAEPNEPREG